MIRRVFMCTVWFVVIYFVLAVISGFAVGMVSVQNEEAARSEGYQAGVQFGREHGKTIFIVAAFLAVVGSFVGVLPGTRAKTDNNQYGN